MAKAKCCGREEKKDEESDKEEEEEEDRIGSAAPGGSRKPACRSGRPQLKTQMLLSQEDLTVTSSLKEEVIYHRHHKSACLTSPAHSSQPRLFTLLPQLSIMGQLSDLTAEDTLMIH